MPEKSLYNDTGELTEHAISRLPAQKPAKEFEYNPKEIFDKPDNAKLKNKKPRDAAGKYLEENPFGLAIVASSEAKGDTDKVRLLTEARAKVIRDYLIQNFRLDDKRVKTISLGKSKEAGGSSKVVIFVYPPKALTIAGWRSNDSHFRALAFAPASSEATTARLFIFR
jgi:hypothetical protein